MKKGAGNQSKIDEEAAEKRNFANFFPPFTPPRIGSMDPLSSIPSPPPWTFFENDKGDCLDVNAITNMLMMWYMCGFHTGSYLAQQKSKSSSKD
ncbi:survival motor neuron protein-like [Cyprinodon tularosa]|nr:survival motor neuron protein-like [Cyprinodon tularosa]